MIHHYTLTLPTFSSKWLLIATVFFCTYAISNAQTEIGWQKTIGTLNDDEPLAIIADDHHHLYVIGNEPHEDFTGLLRPYLMISKLNAQGEEIWKVYHDVAFNTFSPPVGYYLNDHFFTREFDTDLLNLVMNINNQSILYKIDEETGAFFYHETIPSPVIDVDIENGKVYAYTLCSRQQSCYGPDSLVVQRFDPFPDSLIFNPIVWTYELKQNIRTAPIQGHYDFDVQDIRVDADGSTYLLVQIERWDFQFCTDCADAFIDAWCEIFKFDAEGQLVRHVNLKTAKAVVSNMAFAAMDETSILVQINDINAAGTKVITSLHSVDKNLDLIRKFNLDNAYTIVTSGNGAPIYGLTQDNDPGNPQIHGLTDIVLAIYTADGEPSGFHYYGGSSWEFHKGFTLATDGYPVFIARSDSDDFDVLGHIGGSDMWVVKLAEEGSTATNDPEGQIKVSAFPNPFHTWVYLDAPPLNQVVVYDQLGRRMGRVANIGDSNRIDLQTYPSGIYVLQGFSADGKTYFAKVVKQE